MRCGIHTLQLAVWAGLNTDEAKKHLEKIRKAVDKLRTPTFRSLLIKKFGYSQKSECITRWGSTFLMLDRFLKFQDFCEEVSATGVDELKLLNRDWINAKNIRDLLEKPYLATLRLQAADLTPGIFYKEWCYLKKHFEQDDGGIAAKILASMKQREERLFSNTHLLAAIYVDPRYRILLTPEQQLSAKQGLLDIAIRIEKLKATESICVLSDVENEDIEIISNSGDEFEKELDTLAKEQCKTKKPFSQEKNFERTFYENCDKIEKIGRIKVANVFEGLQNYPTDIQLACQIVSSMPVSQVSVERLFSALKILMSDLRFSLKEDLLSSMLFYRCNCNE